MSAKHITTATLGFLAVSALAAPQILQAQQAPVPFQMQSPASAQPVPTLGSIPAPGATQPSAQATSAQNASFSGSITGKLPVRTDLLKTVMAKQEEMLLLDLDIKKATLEKQLAEISDQKSISMLGKDLPVPPLASTMPIPEDIAMPEEPSTTPASITISRIRRQNDVMQAQLNLATGGSINVEEGTIVSGRWKVTEISAASVKVVDLKKKNAKPVELEYSMTSENRSPTSAAGKATGFGIPGSGY